MMMVVMVCVVGEADLRLGGNTVVFVCTLLCTDTLHYLGETKEQLQRSSAYQRFKKEREESAPRG